MCLQAESVNELVGARTAAAADSALAGLTGGIGATVQRLRLSALTLLAELEVWVPLQVPCFGAQLPACAAYLRAMLTCLHSQPAEPIFTQLTEQYLYCMLAVIGAMMLPGMLLQCPFMLHLTASA